MRLSAYRPKTRLQRVLLSLKGQLGASPRHMRLIHFNESMLKRPIRAYHQEKPAIILSFSSQDDRISAARPASTSSWCPKQQPPAQVALWEKVPWSCLEVQSLCTRRPINKLAQKELAPLFLNSTWPISNRHQKSKERTPT